MSHELVASEPLCSASTDACWQRDRRVDVGFRTGN
jgi:outer membrane protein OmpA-like peptidoglycan-associated protein